jgi:hypothetical protein
MARVLTDKEKNKLKKEIKKEIKNKTFGIRKFSREWKCSETTVRRLLLNNNELNRLYNKYLNNNNKTKTKIRGNKKSKQTNEYVKEVEKSFDETKGTVTTRSLDIKTVEQALKVAEVDLNIWEVDRHIINTWEVTVGGIKTGTGKCETYTNFQVKIWLRRKSEETLAIEQLLSEMKKHSVIIPKFNINKKEIKNKRELEISLMDLHLGLRCFAPSADITWTPKDAEIMTMAMLEELINLAAVFGPYERIVFPIGNDFLHADNVYGTTTSNTPQPEADAWHNNFKRAEKLGLAIIERMLKVAPIKVISVPGNHARHSEIALGRILQAYYHNNKNVEIDATLSPYKFHNYGVNLLGFEHGHSIKQQVRLAALMANECRLDGVWEKARYCEWHLGDQHRKGSGKPHMFEEQGVSVEFLPGLTPPNEWHRIHSFNWQKRAGMAFVWDKSAGPISRFQVNVDNYTGKIMR